MHATNYICIKLPPTIHYGKNTDSLTRLYMIKGDSHSLLIVATYYSITIILPEFVQNRSCALTGHGWGVLITILNCVNVVFIIGDPGCRRLWISIQKTVMVDHLSDYVLLHHIEAQVQFVGVFISGGISRYIYAIRYYQTKSLLSSLLKPQAP